MSSTFVGIDPGAKGAIAIIFPDGDVSIKDMPTLDEFPKILVGYFPVAKAVGVEQVHPLPGQSCTASFTYGENNMLAKLIGKCYNNTLTMVPPQRWKKFFGLKREPGESKAQFKRKSVDLARKLFPSCAELLKYSKDGRAEALLIAEYLRQTWTDS